MPEIGIYHFIVLVRPDDGVITAVPYLRGAQWKTGRVNGTKHFDVAVVAKIIGPAIPLAYCRSKSSRQAQRAGMRAVFTFQNSRGWSPGIGAEVT